MQLASGLASFFIFCPLERLSTIPADHIDLTRRPDDGAATGAYMLDTAVLGFFAPALCRAFHWLATGVDFILAQGFSDPGLCLGCGLELHTIGQKVSSKSLKTYLFSLPKGTQKPCRSGANQINKLGAIALTYIFVFHQKSTFLSVYLHTLYILQQ